MTTVLILPEDAQPGQKLTLIKMLAMHSERLRIAFKDLSMAERNNLKQEIQFARDKRFKIIRANLKAAEKKLNATMDRMA